MKLFFGFYKKRFKRSTGSFLAAVSLTLFAPTGLLANGTPTNFAPNCSVGTGSVSTHENQMQLSQYGIWTGKGYGYTSATASWAPYNSGGGSAAINLGGVPGAPSVVVAAYLETVQMVQPGYSCANSWNVNGTAVNGITTGFADMGQYWTSPAYGTTSVQIDPNNSFCNERYDVTSLVTAKGNGTYTVTSNGGSYPWGLLTASIVVVYQNPGAATTSTVTLADGIYAWITGDGDGNFLFVGDAPSPANMSFCGNTCATTPSGDGFTRIGGGGLPNDSDAGVNPAGYDTFTAPGTTSPPR